MLDLDELLSIQNDRFRSLISILSERSRRFSQDQFGEAENLKNSQPQLWRAAFDIAGLQDSVLSDERNRFDRPQIEKSIEQAFSITKVSFGDSEDVIVNGTIPILTNEKIKSLRYLSSPDAGLICAALLIECSTIFSRIKASSIPLNVLGYMFVYSAGGATNTEISTRIVNTEKKIEETRRECESLVEILNTKTSKFIDDESEKLAAYKSSLSEEIKLRSASTLWNDRAV